MKCNRFRKYLIPFSEGTLPEHLSESLRAHVASCIDCAHELEEIQGMVQVLQNSSYPSIEPSVDLRSRVMARIAKDPAPKPSRWFIVKQYATAAVALAICVVALNFATMSSNHGPDSGKSSHALTSKETERLRSLGYIGGPAPAGTPAPKDVVKADVRHSHKQRSTSPASPLASHPIRGSRVAKIDAAAPAVASYSGVKAQSGSVVMEMRMTPKVAAPPAVAMNRLETDSFCPSTGSAQETAPQHSKGLTSGTARSPRLAMGRSAGMAAKHTSPDATINGFGGTDSGGANTEKSAISDNAFGIVKGDTLPLDGHVKPSPKVDIHALEASLKSSPNSQSIILSLVNAYRDAGRVDDEFRMAQRLTKLDAGKSGYWLLLGKASEKAKHPHTALAAYNMAIKTGLADSELEFAKNRLAALKETSGE